MKAAIILMTFSFIADQLLQAKTIRQSKHKDSTSLLVHVLTWSVPMFIFALLVAIRTDNVNMYAWWIISCVSHYAIEWCCLRMWTQLFYDKKKSQMAFWILLEHFLLNTVMILMLDYYVG